MRLRRILGITLVVLAFVFLVGFIIFPVIPQLADSPVFDSILGVVLCQPGETLVRDPYSQVFGGEQTFTMNVYCQDAKKKQVDVTSKWTGIGVVGFVALFLPGMYITTGTLSTNRKRKRVPDDSGNAFRVTPEQVNEYRQKTRAQHGSANGTGQAAANGRSAFDHSGGDDDFSHKLKQIQEAHDSGLISDEEYEHLRQNILDEMK